MWVGRVWVGVGGGRVEMRKKGIVKERTKKSNIYLIKTFFFLFSVSKK